MAERVAPPRLPLLLFLLQELGILPRGLTCEIDGLDPRLGIDPEVPSSSASEETSEGATPPTPTMPKFFPTSIASVNLT